MFWLPSEWCDFYLRWLRCQWRTWHRKNDIWSSQRPQIFSGAFFWVDFLNTFRRLVLKMTLGLFRGAVCSFFFAELEFVDVRDFFPKKTVSSSWLLQKFLGLGRVGRSRLGVSQPVGGTPKTQLPIFVFWGDSFCWGGSWRPVLLWAWCFYS